MVYQLKYQVAARQDVKDAKTWYKSQLPGLQKKFAADIKRAILRIQKHPETHSIRYKNIRIAHPEKFPYGIHYYIDARSNEIAIVAIIHERQDQQIIEDRH